MNTKATAKAKTGQAKQPVKPAEPMHYKFLTEVALDIYDAAITKGASNKGALFVISHAAIESGWALDALKYKDYNLFGMMTLGTDFKRKTSHGNVKDYSNSGGFKASMDDYFAKIDSHKWSGTALIAKIEITFSDIDKAFNTGEYYPTNKQRHDGAYAYNADMDSQNKNHYGEYVYKQMKSVKKRLLEALSFKIDSIEKVTELSTDEKQSISKRLTNIRDAIDGVTL